MAKTITQNTSKTVDTIISLFEKIEITTLTVEAGKQITIENFPGHFIYHIVEGQVMETYFTEKTDTYSKVIRNGSDWVGYSVLYNNNTYMASAITLEPSILLQFPVNEVRKLMYSNHSVSDYINNMVRLDLYSLYFLSLRNKVE